LVSRLFEHQNRYRVKMVRRTKTPTTIRRVPHQGIFPVKSVAFFTVGVHPYAMALLDTPKEIVLSLESPE